MEDIMKAVKSHFCFLLGTLSANLFGSLLVGRRVSGKEREWQQLVEEQQQQVEDKDEKQKEQGSIFNATSFFN